MHESTFHLIPRITNTPPHPSSPAPTPFHPLPSNPAQNCSECDALTLTGGLYSSPGLSRFTPVDLAGKIAVVRLNDSWDILLRRLSQRRSGATSPPDSQVSRRINANAPLRRSCSADYSFLSLLCACVTLQIFLAQLFCLQPATNVVADMRSLGAVGVVFINPLNDTWTYSAQGAVPMAIPSFNLANADGRTLVAAAGSRLQPGTPVLRLPAIYRGAFALSRLPASGKSCQGLFCAEGVSLRSKN